MIRCRTRESFVRSSSREIPKLKAVFGFAAAATGFGAGVGAALAAAAGWPTCNGATITTGLTFGRFTFKSATEGMAPLAGEAGPAAGADSVCAPAASVSITCSALEQIRDFFQSKWVVQSKKAFRTKVMFSFLHIRNRIYHNILANCTKAALPQQYHHLRPKVQQFYRQLDSALE